MKKATRNSGVSLLLAIIFFSGPLYGQEKKSAKALLWRVSGKDLKEPSYLFGTYHLLGKEFLTTVPETDKAFAQAKGVVVETIIDSSKMMSLTMKSMMPEKRISTLMSAEDYKLVADEFQRLAGYDLNIVNMLKPAHIGAVISVLLAQEANRETFTQYAGPKLDMHFAQEAKRMGKTLTQLETMDEQFAMLFDHETEEEQARQLVEVVKQKELGIKSSIDLTRLYLEKDIAGLFSLMESYPKELTGNTEHLLKDRNEKWIKILPGLMNSGSQFIAVGAGHLPGPDGLIALLEKEGYTVTPVTK